MIALLGAIQNMQYILRIPLGARNSMIWRAYWSRSNGLIFFGDSASVVVYTGANDHLIDFLKINSFGKPFL